MEPKNNNKTTNYTTKEPELFCLSNNVVHEKQYNIQKEPTNNNYRVTLSEKINKLQHDLKLTILTQPPFVFGVRTFYTPVIHIQK